MSMLPLSGYATAAALAAALWSLAPQGLAQSYPARPVRIIVPFSAGGPADLLARVIGEKLQHGLGQSIVVLSKDGAGTILGVDMAAKSSPDGHTLLLGNVANSGSGSRSSERRRSKWNDDTHGTCNEPRSHN
ncbi:MAG: tripartite tricarboxylate transporter substrate-binding protein [Burkholderiales bacterium]|nr:tripartite tricarboxylate transporter substrate-binding protein [Burkholderiales bacterium]